jgi:hypothetical protein
MELFRNASQKHADITPVMPDLIIKKHGRHEAYYDVCGEWQPLTVWKQRGYDIDILQRETIPDHIKTFTAIGVCYRVALLKDGQRGSKGTSVEIATNAKAKKRKLKKEDLEKMSAAAEDPVALGGAEGEVVGGDKGGDASEADSDSDFGSSDSSSSSSKNKKGKKEKKRKAKEANKKQKALKFASKMKLKSKELEALAKKNRKLYGQKKRFAALVNNKLRHPIASMQQQ